MVTGKVLGKVLGKVGYGRGKYSLYYEKHKYYMLYCLTRRFYENLESSLLFKLLKGDEKMEEKKKRKRGEEPRDQEIHMRMTRSEVDAIELASYQLDDSKTDVVRKALKMYLSGLGIGF